MIHHPDNHDDGDKYILWVIAALVIAIFAISMTSCTVTTAPDGTSTSQPDYNAWLEITRLILTDEAIK